MLRKLGVLDLFCLYLLGFLNPGCGNCRAETGTDHAAFPRTKIGYYSEQFHFTILVTSMQDSKRGIITRYLPLFLLCAAFAAIGMRSLNDLSLYTPDSSRYLIWAKSLGSLDGFRDDTSPEPQRYVIHAPLYALLLAPVGRAFPYDIVAAKMCTLGFGIVLLIFLYGWISRKYGSGAALAGTFLIAFNPMILLYSTEVLSDIPFALCIIAFFFAFDKFAEAPPDKKKIFWLVLIVTCGILVREVGISLLASALVYLLMKKEYKKAIILFELPVIVYIAWFVRNEWLVAGTEHPGLTNRMIYFHHYFTAEGESFFNEFLGRITANAGIYLALFGKLLFAPLYGNFFYDVLYRSDPSVLSMARFVDAVRIPMFVLTFGVSACGLYADFRGSAAAALKWIFLVIYGVIILMYPINDIRFLLPYMILMAYYFVIGGAWLIGMVKPVSAQIRFVFAAVLLAVLCIPNLIWCRAYSDANRSYWKFFAGSGIVSDTLRAGGHFNKPLPLVAKWLKDNADPTAIILSQWKDIACCSGGRKVVNVNETVPVIDFEYYLRDYDVGYIVVLRQVNGMREFEFQMRAARKYSFEKAYEIGVVQVFKVARNSVAPGLAESGTSAAEGLNALTHDRFDDAVRVFTQVRNFDSLNFASQYYLAVATELTGNLRAADSLFAAFRYMPQSGMYLELSANHREVIDRLIRVDTLPDPSLRAATYASIAITYWQMGFPLQTRRMLEKALAQDPASLPALVYSTYTAFEWGDTAAAELYFLRLKKTNQFGGSLTNLDEFFRNADSLALRKDTEGRRKTYLEMASALNKAKLPDCSIEAMQRLLAETPRDREGLMMLADLYKNKRRYAPAKKSLLTVLAVNQNDAEAKRKLDEIERLME